MILVLTDEQKEDLKFLVNLDESFVGEFGRISIEFALNGGNAKVFSSAAKNLSVETEVVEQVVAALCYVFTEAAKLRLTGREIAETIADSGIPEGAQQQLISHYEENCSRLRTRLESIGKLRPQFDQLRWRLDVNLANRTAVDGMRPSYLLELSLGSNSSSEEGKTHTLQCDYPTLKAITDELEKAARDISSVHTRRILKYIK